MNLLYNKPEIFTSKFISIEKKKKNELVSQFTFGRTIITPDLIKKKKKRRFIFSAEIPNTECLHQKHPKYFVVVVNALIRVTNHGSVYLLKRSIPSKRQTGQIYVSKMVN